MKSLNAVDLAKSLFALCVVCIHVSAIAPINYSPTFTFIIRCAVPFFFLTSGYLLYKKIEKADDAFEVCKTYAIRILKMYALWICIYIPLAIWIYATEGKSLSHSILLWLRGVLFIGETPSAWPLWYLLALGEASLVIGWLMKKRIPLYAIWLGGMALMGIGFWMSGIDGKPLSGLSALAYKGYFGILGTTRNFLFQGIGYVATGMAIARVTPPQLYRRQLLLSLLSITLAIVLYNLGTQFWTVAAGAAALTLCLAIHLPDHPIYKTLRTLSTDIYLTHMYVLFALKLLLPSVTTDPATANLHLFTAIALPLAIGVSIFTRRLSDSLHKKNYFCHRKYPKK